MLTNNVSGGRKERNNMQKKERKVPHLWAGFEREKDKKKKTLGRCKSEKLRNIQSSTLNDCNIT